jgi:hypothetical protein
MYQTLRIPVVLRPSAAKADDHSFMANGPMERCLVFGTTFGLLGGFPGEMWLCRHFVSKHHGAGSPRSWRKKLSLHEHTNGRTESGFKGKDCSIKVERHFVLRSEVYIEATNIKYMAY